MCREETKKEDEEEETTTIWEWEPWVFYGRVFVRLQTLVSGVFSTQSISLCLECWAGFTTEFDTLYFAAVRRVFLTVVRLAWNLTLLRRRRRRRRSHQQKFKSTNTYRKMKQSGCVIVQRKENEMGKWKVDSAAARWLFWFSLCFSPAFPSLPFLSPHVCVFGMSVHVCL